ncbi:hypothetical protein RUMOBE_02725 [Blautia obeum ATCC 29174]|uniref:Uncharacterized protein n=1 Tax=Blautia obeum ATCC 29174 TaxID=411459 RepID=A5ZUP0_9FIRM|nr:hypothetical protein RUMOBE_02725 [Blautia obeum ATCC 29174]
MEILQALNHKNIEFTQRNCYNLRKFAGELRVTERGNGVC